ncbi:hypothetical protein, partial [Stieleria mannarensis]|uniref:hypothetical protein n=1 Tax=Stieleria mannarensis TaxID=2755585 RepID=UPI0016042C64
MNELSVIYEQEPELRDVYVEGQRDRGLITWYFGRDIDLSTYEAGDIDLPAELLANHGQTPGNRGRAIALAMELQERVANHQQCKFAVVVDADCDYAIGIENSCPVLFRTDLANTEMYLHDSRVIQNFIDLNCPGAIGDPYAFLQETSGNLRKVFAVRSAIQSLGLNVKIVPFEKL